VDNAGSVFKDINDDAFRKFKLFYDFSEVLLKRQKYLSGSYDAQHLKQLFSNCVL